MKISSKQEKFIEEYLIDGNATQAAIRAGYSQQTAQEQSSRLLSKVIISDEIKRRKEELAKANTITKEDILNKLQRILNNNIDSRDKLAMDAIKIINDMLGFDAPVKQDITTNGQSIIPTTISVNINKPKKDNE